MTDSLGSMLVVRQIKAPVKEVFRAWTDPKRFAQWMGGKQAVAVTHQMDARTGGHYRFEVRVGDEVHTTYGEYLEVVPNRRIVKTWIYEGPFRDFVGSTTRVTVELREIKPDCTELTLKHERLPSAAYGDSVRDGWTQCLDQIEQMFAEDALR